MIPSDWRPEGRKGSQATARRIGNGGREERGGRRIRKTRRAACHLPAHSGGRGGRGGREREGGAIARTRRGSRRRGSFRVFQARRNRRARRPVRRVRHRRERDTTTTTPTRRRNDETNDGNRATVQTVTKGHYVGAQARIGPRETPHTRRVPNQTRKLNHPPSSRRSTRKARRPRAPAALRVNPRRVVHHPMPRSPASPHLYYPVVSVVLQHRPFRGERDARVPIRRGQRRVLVAATTDVHPLSRDGQVSRHPRRSSVRWTVVDAWLAARDALPRSSSHAP